MPKNWTVEQTLTARNKIQTFNEPFQPHIRIVIGYAVWDCQFSKEKITTALYVN